MSNLIPSSPYRIALIAENFNLFNRGRTPSRPFQKPKRGFFSYKVLEWPRRSGRIPPYLITNQEGGSEILIEEGIKRLKLAVFPCKEAEDDLANLERLKARLNSDSSALQEQDSKIEAEHCIETKDYEEKNSISDQSESEDNSKNENEYLNKGNQMNLNIDKTQNQKMEIQLFENPKNETEIKNNLQLQNSLQDFQNHKNISVGHLQEQSEDNFQNLKDSNLILTLGQIESDQIKEDLQNRLQSSDNDSKNKEEILINQPQQPISLQPTCIDPNNDHQKDDDDQSDTPQNRAENPTNLFYKSDPTNQKSNREIEKDESNMSNKDSSESQLILNSIAKLSQVSIEKAQDIKENLTDIQNNVSTTSPLIVKQELPYNEGVVSEGDGLVRGSQEINKEILDGEKEVDFISNRAIFADISTNPKIEIEEIEEHIEIQTPIQIGNINVSKGSEIISFKEDSLKIKPSNPLLKEPLKVIYENSALEFSPSQSQRNTTVVEPITQKISCFAPNFQIRSANFQENSFPSTAKFPSGSEDLDSQRDKEPFGSQGVCKGDPHRDPDGNPVDLHLLGVQNGIVEGGDTGYNRTSISREGVGEAESILESISAILGVFLEGETPSALGPGARLIRRLFDLKKALVASGPEAEAGLFDSLAQVFAPRLAELVPGEVIPNLKKFQMELETFLKESENEMSRNRIELAKIVEEAEEELQKVNHRASVIESIEESRNMIGIEKITDSIDSHLNCLPDHIVDLKEVTRNESLKVKVEKEGEISKAQPISYEDNPPTPQKSNALITQPPTPQISYESIPQFPNLSTLLSPNPSTPIPSNPSITQPQNPSTPLPSNPSLTQLPNLSIPQPPNPSTPQLLSSSSPTIQLKRESCPQGGFRPGSKIRRSYQPCQSDHKVSAPSPFSKLIPFQKQGISSSHIINHSTSEPGRIGLIFPSENQKITEVFANEGAQTWQGGPCEQGERFSLPEDFEFVKNLPEPGVHDFVSDADFAADLNSPVPIPRKTSGIPLWRSAYFPVSSRPSGEERPFSAFPALPGTSFDQKNQVLPPQQRASTFDERRIEDFFEDREAPINPPRPNFTCYAHFPQKSRSPRTTSLGPPESPGSHEALLSFSLLRQNQALKVQLEQATRLIEQLRKTQSSCPRCSSLLHV